MIRLFPGPLDERARRTFAGDCLRQFFNGLTDTGPRTFFLLIAVQRFSAGDLAKTLISIPGSAGMALSLLLIPLLSRSGISKTRWLSWARALTGICYLAAAFWPSLGAYAFWIFLGGLPASMVYPLLTSLYHENYPRHLRGRLFASAVMVNMVSSAFFHWIIGLILGTRSAHYQLVLASFAGASLLSAWAIARIPDPGGSQEEGRFFMQALISAVKDRTFAYMLLVWFVFGFANLMMTPLKVLFLTESRYGFVYPAAKVALLIGIIPEATRFLFTPMWARLFDRRDFVSVRMVLNGILLAALAAFFLGGSLPWFYLAAVLEGVFSSGANIAWALWVTQVAPKGRTAEYMSVHQFFTGIRGVTAAFLGITLASQVGLRPVAWAALALVLLSILMMLPARGDVGMGSKPP